MTTEKALCKIMEVAQLYGDTHIEETDYEELKNTFASYLYPHTYKKSPRKAVAKTMTDFEVCEKLNYIDFSDDGDTLEEVIGLTKEGSLRIEKRSDHSRNVFIRILCAVGGAVGTVLCSLFIELIKSAL